MTGWAIKRFWTQTHVTPADGGFAVTLDIRPLRTPAKALLILPTHALATLVAAEWQAQTGKVDPRQMPMTRMANSAIDKVRPQHAEVAALLAAYGATDHLCYRAETPAELAARQARAWDPVLDWAAAALGARLNTGPGIIPVAQNPDAIAHLHARVTALDPFALAAFHDLVSLSGSLILGFGVATGAYDPAHAWQLSRIDEDWQQEVWGDDADASATAALKAAAFLDAARFFLLSQTADALPDRPKPL